MLDLAVPLEFHEDSMHPSGREAHLSCLTSIVLLVEPLSIILRIHPPVYEGKNKKRVRTLRPIFLTIIHLGTYTRLQCMTLSCITRFLNQAHTNGSAEETKTHPRIRTQGRGETYSSLCWINISILNNRRRRNVSRLIQPLDG